MASGPTASRLPTLLGLELGLLIRVWLKFVLGLRTGHGNESRRIIRPTGESSASAAAFAAHVTEALWQRRAVRRVRWRCDFR